MAEPIGTVFCKATQWERFMVGQKNLFFKILKSMFTRNPQNFEFYNYVKKMTAWKATFKNSLFFAERVTQSVIKAKYKSNHKEYRS